MNTKYVFVTGGVASSLGKGIVAASLAKLLQARGLRVTIQKFDPYINIDPGTLNPYEHGECYVTEDGAETDLDLGHYERFLGVHMSKANNVTTGKIYNTVITKEREGAYLGKTVQIVPHITDEIKRRMLLLGKTGKYDVVITEVGGTMRLGAYACRLLPGTLASRIYGGQDVVYERHRHRYEFNDAYRAAFEQAGMAFSGTNPDTGLVEIVEIPSHPFFIGAQFHPEFKSTPEQPQPIFTAFVKAAADRSHSKASITD